MRDTNKIRAFNHRERALLVLTAASLIGFLILLDVMFHIQTATSTFHHRANDIYFKTNQSLGNIDAALSTLVGLYHAQESLNPSELISFSQELLNAYHAFDAILYLPLIPAEEIHEYERSIKDSGFPEFRIQDSTGRDTDPEYIEGHRLPIGFIEPLDPGSAALLGIDLLSYDDLRAFLRHAIVQGRTTFSAPVQLLENRPRIYGFKAVYKGYFMPESVDERLIQVQGMFAVEIDMPHIFWHALEQIPKIGARITLSTPDSNEVRQIIFQHQPSESSSLFDHVLPDLKYTARLGQTGQELTLDLYTTITVQDLHPAEITLILLISTLLAAAVVQVLRFRRISAIKERIAQDQIFAQQARAEATLHSIGEAVITTNIQGVIEYMNPMAEKLTGWTLDSARGKDLMEIFDLIDERSGNKLSSPVARRIASKAGKHEERALMRRRDGKTIAVADKTALLKDRQGDTNGVVLVIRDVSLEKLTQQMAFLANHDPLTQLANRRAFEKALQQSIEDARQTDSVHALCFIDLDHFKMINDSCGHMAGDRLLTQVTSRLKLHVRRSDVLARIGGDEFALLLSNCPLPRATEITEAIRKDVKDFKLHWNDKAFSVSTSIGIVPIDANCINPDSVMKAADNACYISKKEGRNRIHLYRPNDSTISQERKDMRWIRIIQEGLQNSSFALFLQSFRSLKQAPKEAEMHEFLLRLPSGNSTFIPPSTMIDLAQRYNKMFDIDCWVIHHAFQTIRKHFQERPEKKANTIYSINVSGQSLGHPGLIPYIRKELRDQAISPDNICFEINETAMVSNLDQALTLTNELRSLGCHMALDNFGTGLGSFSYLKKLSFDFLKIDGTFVRGSVHEPSDRIVVDTINRVGVALKMRVIAEWVEDKATFALLGDLGINYAQGFFVAKPKPVYPAILDKVNYYHERHFPSSL